MLDIYKCGDSVTVVRPVQMVEDAYLHGHALLDVGFNAVSTVFPWKTRRWMLCQAQAASCPVNLAQSCFFRAEAEAVAHAGPPREELDGPGAFLVLGVA